MSCPLPIYPNGSHAWIKFSKHDGKKLMNWYCKQCHKRRRARNRNH